MYCPLRARVRVWVSWVCRSACLGLYHGLVVYTRGLLTTCYVLNEKYSLGEFSSVVVVGGGGGGLESFQLYSLDSISLTQRVPRHAVSRSCTFYPCPSFTLSTTVSNPACVGPPSPHLTPDSLPVHFPAGLPYGWDPD